MKLHETEIIGRERFGNHTLLRYRWTGEPPEPGQFVMARTVKSAHSFNPFLSRPFFAHDYDDGVASLLFEIRGRGTTLLAEKDSVLLVSAPLGQGFTVENRGPVALVGGGVWVAPLKLLSRRLAEFGVPYDVFLEVASTAPKDYAGWISKNYPEAMLLPTDGSPASSAQTVLECVGDLARYRALYTSGPVQLLAAVKSASLGGTTSVQLALRERMACANGSCYGCAVPIWESEELTYARACIEGPVFPAEVLGTLEQ
jgi:dihydroorotate dehydrogenase electron transfer subunit